VENSRSVEPRREKHLRAIVLTCLLLTVAPRVGVCDGYFRCGSSLVSADLSLSELVQKCGYPSTTETSVVDVRNESGAKVGTSTIEIWRYDRGTRAAAMLVKVVDGRIENIKDESFDARQSRQPQ
jgi:Protein of unknown function (DUF2845)